VFKTLQNSQMWGGETQSLQLQEGAQTTEASLEETLCKRLRQYKYNLAGGQNCP